MEDPRQSPVTAVQRLDFECTMPEVGMISVAEWNPQPEKLSIGNSGFPDRESSRGKSRGRGCLGKAAAAGGDAEVHQRPPLSFARL
jgi:hypothetical protein